MSRATAVRKHSNKRDAILAEIRLTKSHPGAQWVYDRLKPRIPDLSLATVYRNISQFREEGTVVSLGAVNGEERFDGSTGPHPHLICRHCGQIIDLPSPGDAYLKRLEEDFIDKMETDDDLAGFNVDYRQTTFYGTCKQCLKEETKIPESQKRMLTRKSRP
jgi:Fur family peroxide stress response transcriptional regulator